MAQKKLTEFARRPILGTSFSRIFLGKNYWTFHEEQEVKWHLYKRLKGKTSSACGQWWKETHSSKCNGRAMTWDAKKSRQATPNELKAKVSLSRQQVVSSRTARDEYCRFIVHKAFITEKKALWWVKSSKEDFGLLSSGLTSYGLVCHPALNKHRVHVWWSRHQNKSPGPGACFYSLGSIFLTWLNPCWTCWRAGCSM